MPGQLVSGFDPDSFFAGLAQAGVEFLPAPFSETRNLDVALQKVRSAEREAMQNVGGADIFRLNQELNQLDDAAFNSRLEQISKARRKMERIAGTCRMMGGMEYSQAANSTGGRRADALLALAETHHHRTAARPEKFALSIHKGQLVKILHSRAKLRRPAEAQPFYLEAYDAIKSLPPKEPRQWQVAVDIAPMVADWAAIKTLEEAEPLIREAIEILSRPRAGGPLHTFEEVVVCQVQTTILRQHALRHEGKHSRELFAEARKYAERIRSLDDKFMSEYLLGMLDLEEARKVPDEQDQLSGAATTHFLAAIALKESSRGLLICDWGTALATIGRARNGAEGDAFFAQAYEHYKSVADDATASSLAHNNWSGFLLVQARRTAGVEKEKLLTESWTHASKTEELQPAMGAYNLACIAAERADWQTMSNWLRISARSPKLPAPAHTDSVTSFDPIRNEVWFQELLGELYP
jgi:hypothetical protein